MKSGGRTVVPVKASNRRSGQEKPPEEARSKGAERKSKRSRCSQGAEKYFLWLISKQTVPETDTGRKDE